MNKKILTGLMFTLSIIATAAPVAYASNHEFKVGLWGDQFYSDDMAIKAKRTKQTIDSLNQHNLSFTLYAGDTKNGHTKCTDQAIGADIKRIFNALNVPTIYSLGDNEWTDCHRTSNGSYDPLERLAYLRKTFFSTDKSQGTKPLTLTRQATNGKAYSENSRFVKNNVEFVSLAVPGSNNNLVATKKQCTKKSLRTQSDCDTASAEYQARNAKNIDWLKASFKEARDKHYAGVVVTIQADIFFPFELSDGGFKESFLPSLNDKNGFTDFYKVLQSETHNYNGQVLLVHGDSHYFKMDKPMYDNNGQLTANFTRVEVFGEEDNSWVELIVNPNSKEVFTVKPVVLR